eukprot:46891-Eustigmatos_ZCMA.PRE.1
MGYSRVHELIDDVLRVATYHSNFCIHLPRNDQQCPTVQGSACATFLWCGFTVRTTHLSR